MRQVCCHLFQLVINAIATGHVVANKKNLIFQVIKSAYSALALVISKIKVGTTGNPIFHQNGHIHLESCVNAFQNINIFT